jgi:4-hydroxybenzoate polyprenyltransferase
MPINPDKRPFVARLWTFQKERMPLAGMAIMATLSIGAIYHFADTPLRNYLTAVAILILYLIQIRCSDEKKDFEHDNKFHPNRPVQRGVISLAELKTIGLGAIIAQLILYASFMDVRILLLGLLSQFYAFLTRKEFFVREWLRAHFFTYYGLHYIQLVILYTALTFIISPRSVWYFHFVAFAMLLIIMSELGRKMYPVEDDTTDDTYSAQLGHTGSAVAISIVALLSSGYVLFFIQAHAQKYAFALLPITLLVGVFYTAYRYAKSPHRREAKAIENTANLLLIAALIAIIGGA